MDRLARKLARQETLLRSVVFALSLSGLGLGSEFTIFEDPELHHLRIEGPREWSEFPLTSEGPLLEKSFQATENASAYSLRVRQQDVKQRWDISLNGKQLGSLPVDENDMVVYFEIAAGTLVNGENTLRIEQPQHAQPVVDDVRVGEISIDSRPRLSVLNAAIVKIQVVDEGNQEPMPARITIVDRSGALQTTGAASGKELAVRPGTVFTSTGIAEFGLPEGRYTIYAGRGFEYSLDSCQVSVEAGKTVQVRLSIRREVPTEGYVACDTHVHTLTHSGHGDATVEERMITLAAEGIELPIATDHNVNIDYRPYAEAVGVRKFFTPVIGNEVTTQVGHFNVFPIAEGVPPPNHNSNDWSSIFAGIYRTPEVRVAILNHGRDIHSGTRPLGAELHNAVIGENIKGWAAGMNGMEVINSGATQSDALQLMHDWMGFLNRGRAITPVGSSDSHDVGRHFVGQGRTYIRCDDTNPGNIDVRAAVNNFIEGRVLVSYGLLIELSVNGKYYPGDLARVSDDEVAVNVRVLGPHWVRADRVQLFANGQLMREAAVSASDRRKFPTGVLWQEQWMLPMPQHDVHLVAIATGPGIDQPYWKTAKPYQPTSPDWRPQVLACTGAIWLDLDRDGRRTAPFDYAQRVFFESQGDLTKLLSDLADYDAAVAAQAAHLYQSSGNSWLSAEAQQALKRASDKTQTGIRNYIDAWRANQLAVVQQLPQN